MQNCLADEWSLPEKQAIASGNKQYLFSISPNPHGSSSPGKCLGELRKVKGDNRGLVWTRYLINNISPVTAYVSDSGKYVVTIDEWESVGGLPIVIYGRDGRLIKAHCLESLGLENEKRINHTLSGDWWAKDAIIMWGPPGNTTNEASWKSISNKIIPAGETLIIKYPWGKIIIVRLDSGVVVNKSQIYNKMLIDILPEYEHKLLSPYVSELLNSEKAYYRECGIALAGQYKMVEQKEKIIEQLSDRNYYTTNNPDRKIYYIRKAAVETLKVLGEEKNVQYEEEITK